MRIFASSILLVMVSCILTSCWSSKEVNDLAIVTATGLDLTEEGKIRLSLLLAVPRLIGSGSAQGGGSENKLRTSAGWVVSGEGDTVMETFRFIQEKLPRQLFFSHSRIIVIGERLARKGLLEVLDFFERYRQSQMKSYIAISKITASEILNFQSVFEKLPSEVMREEMKQNLIPKRRLVEFLNDMNNQGIEPYAPMIEIVPSEPSQTELYNLAVSGIAVFRGDRMVGQLNDKESRAVMWIRDLVNEGVVTIDINKSKRKGRISAELEKVHVKRSVNLQGGKIEITLNIRATANIYENTAELDLDKPENSQYVIQILKKDIEDRIKQAGEKVQQEYKSDIFGYGQSVYRKNPKAWKQNYHIQWDDKFPRLETKIITKVRVLRTGLTNKTIRVEE
ncbi:Ger(x)C family spore germination protein [Paenibacillus sp. SN-8-1]|uniref:Ger(x)C family spore germination protein n=1 Tax=Paenibacillus sp. SN-8-1 TaxID=3435409 RepID=UPI003D9A7CB0